MATTTLAQMRAEVRLRTNSVSTDTVLTNAIIDGAINDGLRQVSLEHDWPWLFTSETITTAADDGQYPVPADYLRTVSIVDRETGIPLEHRSIIEIDQLTPLDGLPGIYHSYGDSILLAPTPTTVRTYTHRYVRVENVLSGDAATPLVPLEYREGAVEWAARQAFMYVRNPEAARQAETGFYDWLRRARDNMRRTKEPLRIRVRPGSWL